MRKLTWMMPVIGAILIAAGPSRAQTYDPNFPVCLQPTASAAAISTAALFHRLSARCRRGAAQRNA